MEEDEKNSGGEGEDEVSSLSAPPDELLARTGSDLVDMSDVPPAVSASCQSATGMLITHWSAVLREASVTVWKRGSDVEEE